MRSLRVKGAQAIQQRGMTYIIIKLAPNTISNRTIEIPLLLEEWHILVRAVRKALAELRFGNVQGALDQFIEGGGAQ